MKRLKKKKDPETLSSRTLDAFLSSLTSLRSVHGVPICLALTSPSSVGGGDGGVGGGEGGGILPDPVSDRLGRRACHSMEIRTFVIPSSYQILGKEEEKEEEE